MKSTYLSLLQKIKIAMQNKKLILKVKFTYSSLKFLTFLLENNFISGFEQKTQNKQNILTIFLKYDSGYLPALLDFSVVSTSTRKLRINKNLKRQNTNFTTDLYSSNVSVLGLYNNSTLLSKFR